MQNAVKYVLLLRRAAAFLIDFCIIRYFLLWGDHFYLLYVFHYLEKQNVNISISTWILLMLHFAVWLSYFILFENSRFNASFGKWIFKIHIVNDSGTIPSLAVVFVRNFYKLFPIALYQCMGLAVVTNLRAENPNSRDLYTKILPSTMNTPVMQTISVTILCFILYSYGSAFFTKRSQTLHDKMAHTLVVKTDDNPLKQLYLGAMNFIKHLRKANFVDE